MLVFLTKEATKQYKHIPQKHQQRIKNKLSLFESNPYAGKRLTGELKGLLSLKVWPYRIIYLVNKKKKEIWVVSILHRQGAYQR